MMVVDPNKAGNGASATLTGVPSAGATLTGVAAPNGKRKKRPSSLLAVANLPSVETSLEEFIARANQTMVDQQNWDLAEREAKQEDEKRKEADALRWKAAETQLREHEARETSLRRQLDGLQGKLAEAEARVAVALSSSGSMAAQSGQQIEAQAAELSDLRMRAQRAEERVRDAEDRAAGLSQALVAAKQEAHARPSAASMDADPLANERVRLAEAKAAKAIAAARAAAAGLTVSPADIAAIESGLVVPSYAAPKKTPWLAIAGAFIGGLAVMFAVAKLVLKDNPQTVAAAAQPTAAPPPAPQQVQQTQPTPPPKPTVTPIEEPAKADAAKSQVKVEPIDPTPAAEPAKTEPAKAEPPKVVKQEHKAAPTVHHATPAAKKPAGGGIVDPFASPAPAAKKAPEKKPGGLVDPF